VAGLIPVAGRAVYGPAPVVPANFSRADSQEWRTESQPARPTELHDEQALLVERSMGSQLIAVGSILR
jgi:hypothetical protein